MGEGVAGGGGGDKSLFYLHQIWTVDFLIFTVTLQLDSIYIGIATR